jgi:predicted DNA-binding protein YlxM (UPF0122 family)
MVRRNRSDKYQYILCETTFSNDMLESFSNDESIYKRLNPFSYNERVLELEDELKKEFWRVADECLTDRQKEVVKLSMENYTQQEIAKKLNVNQSSITKSLNGNVDYKNGKKVYGGIKLKLIKAVEKDQRVQDILKRISEIRDDDTF